MPLPSLCALCGPNYSESSGWYSRQARQTNLIKFSWPLFYLKLEIFISSRARMKKRKSIYDNYLGETNSRAALRHNCIKGID